MFCPSCGQSVQESYHFCPNCGSSLKGEKPTRVEEQWETCEIICRYITKKAGFFFGDGEVIFTAAAIGPKGAFEAGESEPVPISRDSYLMGVYGERPPVFLPDGNDSRVTDRLNELIKRLGEEGWTSDGTGGFGKPWYNYKFRRAVLDK